jgi:hypothetical protein
MRTMLALCVAALPAIAQNYKVVLVEGHGAINPIAKETRRNFTVRVEQRYGIPGKRVPVTFTAPSSGPSGTFPDADQVVTLRTDDQGYAVVRGFRPNRIPGQYEIRVVAAAPGGTVTASIPQTNALVKQGRESWARRFSRRLASMAQSGRAALTQLFRK